MLGDGTIKDSEDFSMEDPVCIDGVIFYGPMTDREKIVKERFERRQKEKVKTQFLPALSNKDFSGNITKALEGKQTDLNDISIYESFSIDESKYESFNDSLDERKLGNPNEVNVSKFSPEQINVNKRKFQSKQMLKGSLCDSLEDIHSLVSNVEKLSISEEIENINILEKNNIYDDSLKNDIYLENKNFNPTDQNFDDDSLAILDFEKAFDDSLEEADILSLSHMDNVVLRNGENAEISVENIAKENAITKNLFETSVEVIYENAGYIENSEDENAEAPKQLSITADSLSISENISKDSLDGLPVTPKYLEQKTYKRSLSLLNREESDISRNSSKLEYYSNFVNMNERNSIPTSEQNLPHYVIESINEQLTNIKRNSPRANDTIVIEDSFLKTPDFRNSIKREISVESFENEFSSQINNSCCKNDHSKQSSYSALDTNSLANNHKKISKEGVVQEDIQPNDTICIDDSLILPQNTSLCQDKSHLVHTQVAGNQTVNQKNISSNDLGDFVSAKNSVQLTLNIKREKSTPKEKSPPKSINSKFCIQNPMKQKLEDLEKKIHPNDTICIDDSFNLPQDEFYPLKTKQSRSSKNSNQNLTSKNDGISNLKLNDTLNNSLTTPPQPMLNIKTEKSPSSLKRKKDKSSQGKDSRSYFQSPVQYPLRHLEKNNEDTGSNVNDTIFINDSPVEPPRIKPEKKSPSGTISKMSGRSLSQDKKIDSKLHIQSPVEEKLHNLEKVNGAKISNLNDTICIDSSPSESLRIKVDKSPFPSKSSKAQSPEFKNYNAPSKKQSISQPTMVLNSLKESSKSSISDNSVKDPKNMIECFKDALVLPKDLAKSSNLKLHLEVVFNENQGVNIISVSTVDQRTGNITPSVTNGDSKRVMEGKANHNMDLSDKNSVVIKNNVKICESSVASDKIIPKGYSPDLSEVKSVKKSYPDKNKNDSIFTDVLDDSNGLNVQLLEALDLHDASCSFIDSGYLQSRDSIMPLNLCIENRSPETYYQYCAKTESKENVPLFYKQLFTSEDNSKNKRRSSTKASNKTPKPNYNTDVKKSGSKTNSITKIPVRKIDNPFFTPVHQKLSKEIKTGPSTGRFFKNPLVKSNSATDNFTSAKPLETPRKHHFCSVRNSISRVPKSTPRSIPKRFQNIESPVAKYIGKPQIYTPLKTTHRFDGNLILGNTVKTSKHTIKTPNTACKGSPQCSSTGKL